MELLLPWCHISNLKLRWLSWPFKCTPWPDTQSTQCTNSTRPRELWALARKQDWLCGLRHSDNLYFPLSCSLLLSLEKLPAFLPIFAVLQKTIHFRKCFKSLSHLSCLVILAGFCNKKRDLKVSANTLQNETRRSGSRWMCWAYSSSHHHWDYG